ncbi:MAG: hypothetical protein QM731_10435 [Chitinophagaceae bacterium]
MSLLRRYIIEVIAGLQNRGFSNDFRLHGNKFTCIQHQSSFDLHEMEIHEVHYFPGARRMVCDLFVLGVEDPHGNRGILLARRNKHSVIDISSSFKNWMPVFTEPADLFTDELYSVQ